MAQQTFGFIGLGNMGGPLATHLIKAGHALVVCDNNDVAAACNVTALSIAELLGLDHELSCPDLTSYLTGCGAKSGRRSCQACRTQAGADRRPT